MWDRGVNPEQLESAGRGAAILAVMILPFIIFGIQYVCTQLQKGVKYFYHEVTWRLSSPILKKIKRNVTLIKKPIRRKTSNQVFWR